MAAAMAVKVIFARIDKDSTGLCHGGSAKTAEKIGDFGEGIVAAKIAKAVIRGKF
ncbi:MAG: hypothetical protein H0X30_14700 [Anaerolineae bacterium]|nr:hypothetical protein [Anaerolineae bacterium]